MTRGRCGLLLFASYWRCSSFVRAPCALGARKLAGSDQAQELIYMDMDTFLSHILICSMLLVQPGLHEAAVFFSCIVITLVV